MKVKYSKLIEIQTYSKTQNEFVAEFIGLADFIEAKVSNNHAETEIG